MALVLVESLGIFKRTCIPSPHDIFLLSVSFPTFPFISVFSYPGIVDRLGHTFCSGEKYNDTESGYEDIPLLASA